MHVYYSGTNILGVRATYTIATTKKHPRFKSLDLNQYNGAFKHALIFTLRLSTLTSLGKSETKSEKTPTD